MQHVHNQMSDQQSNMNISASYAHTITTYDSQLLDFAANKFLSKQPTCRLGCWRRSCPRAGGCEWRLKLYTLGCIIGPCWALVLPGLMVHPLTIRNSDGIFQEKMVDTCIRRNKATIISISTNVFLFPYHFRSLPFPFHCFSYFLETKLG
jgi:hypothetical protein